MLAIVAAMIAIFAHVGQGTNGFSAGFLHPFTGIDHLLAMVAVGVLAAVVTGRRVAWATPGAFVGGMAIGGALGIAGVRAGFVETTIAASTVVLGGLIAATLIPNFRIGSWAPVIGLGFGAIHGIAHGGEIPSSAHAVSYILGFVAATATLHLSGAFVGTTIGRNAAVRATIGAGVSMAGLAILAGFAA